MIAGNWKMNKTVGETEEFIHRFRDASEGAKDCDILLVPPFPSLDRASQLLVGSGIALGAQDIYYEASGAFTGAVSAQMVAACGCEYVLAGHSERRHVFGDSNEAVRRKLNAILESGLRPILCIGETLDQREGDHTVAVLEHQLEEGLKDVSENELGRIVVAYEPVWAIGTGKTASPDHAQSAIGLIRAWLKAAYSDREAMTVRILYGGSVKPDNVAGLQAQPDVDGMLVGGASLDPDAFAQIVAVAAEIHRDESGC
jgi:triosephosphate isomerase